MRNVIMFDMIHVMWKV